MIPFLPEYTNLNAYTYEYRVDEEFVNKTLAKMKGGTPYNWKTISENNQLQISYEEGGKYIFKVLKPWVIFTLLNEFIRKSPRSNYANEILSQENIIEYLDKIQEQCSKSNEQSRCLDLCFIYAYNSIIKFPSEKERAE